MSMEDERFEENRRPTAGIDWASADHAVAVVDADGVQRDRFSRRAHRLRHCAAWSVGCTAPGSVSVAIERPDGPVVEALLEAELTVFVIAPNTVKSLRGRYGSAGNKDDRFDAYMLADVLRTDYARLRPLTRDSDATITLRMTVRARQDLVRAGGDGQPAPRTPADHPVPARSACSATSTPPSLWVPDPLSQPGQGRLAHRPG